MLGWGSGGTREKVATRLGPEGHVSDNHTNGRWRGIFQTTEHVKVSEQRKGHGPFRKLQVFYFKGWSMDFFF